MLLTVTPLRRSGNDEIEATGFFYNDKAKTYLITCFHVLRPLSSESEEWTATVHLKGVGESSPKKPEQPRSVLKERAAVVKFRVPEDVLFCPTADLCAVEVQDKIGQEVLFRAVDSSRLAMEKTQFWNELMDIGLGIFMPGYPKGLSDTYHHLPLVRSGSLAFDPSLGWNGDDSLGVANMSVFKGDSGAPLFWQGGALVTEVVHKKKHSEVRSAAFQDLKLVGIHCGGYDGQKDDNIEMGVYVKVAVLAEGFEKWQRMEVLRERKFQHPLPSKSNHELHVSSGNWPTERGFEQTELEKKLASRIGAQSDSSVTLIEKRAGRYWTFCFDGKGVLTSLKLDGQTFTRTNLEFVGGAIEKECVRFVCRKKKMSVFDAVFLFCVYPEGRSDNVVLSGIISADLERDDSYTVSQSNIAWIQRKTLENKTCP